MSKSSHLCIEKQIVDAFKTIIEINDLLLFFCFKPDEILCQQYIPSEKCRKQERKPRLMG